MKNKIRATVRELRNNYTKLLNWLKAGEEIIITQNGVAVATLAPFVPEIDEGVLWKDSPEVNRNRLKGTQLSNKQSAQLLSAAKGKW